MNGPDRVKKPASPPSQHSAEGIYHELALAQAASLARGGQYAQAQAILHDLLQNQHVYPDVLDLLARTYAQQGNLDRAAALWQQALELAPGNPAYQTGLRQIAREKRRPAWAALFAIPLLRYAGTTVIFGVVLVALVWMAYPGDGSSPGNEPPGSSLATVASPSPTSLIEEITVTPDIEVTVEALAHQQVAETLSAYELTLTGYPSHVAALEGTITAQATLIVVLSASPTPAPSRTPSLTPTHTMTPPPSFTPAPTHRPPT